MRTTVSKRPRPADVGRRPRRRRSPHDVRSTSPANPHPDSVSRTSGRSQRTAPSASASPSTNSRCETTQALRFVRASERNPAIASTQARDLGARVRAQAVQADATSRLEVFQVLVGPVIRAAGPPGTACTRDRVAATRARTSATATRRLKRRASAAARSWSKTRPKRRDGIRARRRVPTSTNALPTTTPSAKARVRRTCSGCRHPKSHHHGQIGHAAQRVRPSCGPAFPDRTRAPVVPVTATQYKKPVVRAAMRAHARLRRRRRHQLHARQCRAAPSPRQARRVLRRARR